MVSSEIQAEHVRYQCYVENAFKRRYMVSYLTQYSLIFMWFPLTLGMQRNVAPKEMDLVFF